MLIRVGIREKKEKGKSLKCFKQEDNNHIFNLRTISLAECRQSVLESKLCKLVMVLLEYSRVEAVVCMAIVVANMERNEWI